MSSGLKQKWDSMKPVTRQNATIVLIIGVACIGASLFYTFTGEKKKPTVQISEPKRTITVDPKLMEQTITVKSDQQATKIAELQKQVEAMQTGGVVPQGASITSIDPTPNAANAISGMGKNMPAGVPDAGSLQKKARRNASTPALPPGFPPQIGQSNTFGTLPPPPGATGDLAVAPPQREIIGDIEIVSNPGFKPGVGSSGGGASSGDGDKKKADRDIYLPPSYVEATLLNGLYAPTAEGARGNPVPVLLRIRDLAQLPNDVKANIKGCFIISEGVGNLSDERAHLRLKSLSCISKSGESIIDQPVKGFVVDSDGKLGVSGTVVSKMGATITRSLIAGFFGGFGDALKQSSQYQSQTAGILGTTSVMTTDLNNMALSGLGQGVSSAANELAKFYLELSKQTMPVIEVGAAKRVTLVFSEGVVLKVKEFKRTKSRKTKG